MMIESGKRGFARVRSSLYAVRKRGARTRGSAFFIPSKVSIIAHVVAALALLHLVLTQSTAQAVTRLDSPERKAISALRVIVGSLHSKALYGTIVKFADPRRICRTAEDEEISVAEIHLRIRDRANTIDLSRICFHQIVGFTTRTPALRRVYVIELKSSGCSSLSGYLSSTIRNKSLLQSIGTEKQLLIKAGGELTDSNETLLGRLSVASNFFDLDAIEFECVSAEGRLRITAPVKT